MEGERGEVYQQRWPLEERGDSDPGRVVHSLRLLLVETGERTTIRWRPSTCSVPVPAGGRSPFLSSTEKEHAVLKCASPATVQNESRGKGRGSFLLSSPPASDHLPGNVVSCLHSLVEGKNFCRRWGSMRMREKRHRRDPGIYNMHLPMWPRLHLSGEGS